MKNIFIFFFIIIFFFLPTKPVSAKGFTLTQIKPVENKDVLYVSAVLKGEFDKDIIETIHSGIETSLKYYIELKAKGTIWFDQKTSYKILNKTIKYNTLTKEYHLTSNIDEENSTEITKEFDRVKSWMTEINNISIIKASMLSASKDYYFRLKAEMVKKKIWFPLNYLLFFNPFKQINTGWVVFNYKH